MWANFQKAHTCISVSQQYCIHQQHTQAYVTQEKKQECREANETRPLTPFSLISGLIMQIRCSIFKPFEISDCFPYPMSLLASFIPACVFIVKAIIMNYPEDLDVSFSRSLRSLLICGVITSVAVFLLHFISFFIQFCFRCGYPLSLNHV